MNARALASLALALAACTAATPGAGPTDTPAAAPAVTKPQDLAGLWRLCDTGSQANPQELNAVPYGGLRVSVTAQGGVLLATMGGAYDGGLAQVLDGPIDMTSRTWTADVCISEGLPLDRSTGTATLVFGADGTRLTGAYLDSISGSTDIWYGGREDGTFTCESGGAPADGGGSGSGQCTGLPTSCDSLVPPNCGSVDGCTLNIDAFGNDTCQGASSSCQDMRDAYECTHQGCSWR